MTALIGGHSRFHGVTTAPAAFPEVQEVRPGSSLPARYACRNARSATLKELGYDIAIVPSLWAWCSAGISKDNSTSWRGVQESCEEPEIHKHEYREPAPTTCQADDFKQKLVDATKEIAITSNRWHKK
jgi:hypothetical protein